MSNLSVLIVEDDPTVNRLLTVGLKRYGKVRTAFNGKEALDLVTTEVPDLIISDLMMPVMDGMELLVALRQEPSYSDIRFIMLTALKEKLAQVQALQAGANAFVNKPFSLEDLHGIVAYLFSIADQKGSSAQGSSAQAMTS